MSATTLLSVLEEAGVHVIREGDTLRVRGNPGVDPAPYRERIHQHKPALLVELLKSEIMAALDVEPDRFDRAAYDRLWSLLRTHEAKETTS